MARPTKRRTKHRGNAAGMIESRGVTHARSRSTGSGSAPGRARVDPRLREPSWRSAFIRALFAAGVFVLVMLLALKGQPGAVLVTGLMLVAVYTPFGFYFDRFMYNRRMAKLGQAAGRAPAPKPRGKKR
ncbi:hypothetical protein ACVU7I_10590 [Patulibacter sp. S7RM1-6]